MAEPLPRYTCPHCGTKKLYPMALCGKCSRFSNGQRATEDIDDG